MFCFCCLICYNRLGANALYKLKAADAIAEKKQITRVFMKFIDKLFLQAKLFFKGIFISFGFMVPGMSGGTLALIAGIYHKLLRSVSSFFKDIKSNLLFLGVVGAGAIVGVLLLSNILSRLMLTFRIPITYLFLGLIVGGLPLLFGESRKKGKSSPINLMYILIGAAVVVLIATVSKHYLGGINAQDELTRWAIFLPAGVFVAIALILPGISTTAFLEALGIFEQVINAIKNFDIMYLLPLCIGAVLGVILTTRLFEKLLENKPQQTYLLIIGFVLGSLGEIYPGFPQGIDILWSLLLLAAGTALVLFLTHVTKNARANSAGQDVDNAKESTSGNANESTSGNAKELK